MPSIKHITELVRLLRDTEKALEPLTVVAIGSDYYVIDGHHRLAAYYAARWNKAVPVRCFQGSVEAARLEALRGNIRGKLPMTGDDKKETAWKLTKETNMSMDAVVTETTVSLSTVKRMRRMIKEKPGLRDFTWLEAKRDHLPTLEDSERDSWRTRKVANMVAALLTNTGGKLARDPDVLADALEMINPELPRLLVHYWFALAEELVEEHAELGI